MIRLSTVQKVTQRDEEKLNGRGRRTLPPRAGPRSPESPSPANGRPPLRFSVIVAAAAFALAGCNANQGVNPSGQASLGAIYPNYSPYNPIQYAQTSGFYGGR